MLLPTLFSALALVSGVASHGAVTSYIIGGVTYPGYRFLFNPLSASLTYVDTKVTAPLNPRQP